MGVIALVLLTRFRSVYGFLPRPGSTVHCIYGVVPPQDPGQSPGQNSGPKSDQKSGQQVCRNFGI